MKTKPEKPIIKFSHSHIPFIVQNIDDLMQQKYDNDDPNSRFEFREEYWEQALALIEADEAQRRKKRRWLLWWCLAGLLLLSAGYGFWETNLKNAVAKKDGHLENASVAAPIQGQKQDATDISAQAGAVVSAEKSKGENAPIERNESIKSSYKNNPGNAPQLPALPLAIGQQAGKTAQYITAGKAAANSTLSLKSLPDSTATSTRPDPNTAQIPDLPSHATNAGIYAAAEPDKAPEPEEGLIKEILSLPLPMDTVCSNKTTVAPNPSPVPAPATQHIKPIRDSRFLFGLAAATAAYQPAPDKRWLGFSGGLFTSYKFSENWSASLGLGMRYQPGNWLDTAGNIATESLRYSFGFESLKTQRRALGLVSLEIPVAAVWHRGVFAAEAGIAPGRLLAAVEQYKEINESSLQSPNTTINRLERGETSIYHQFYANAFAGLEWKCSQNLSVNVRGNYRLGAILKATPEDPSIKGGSNLELGLRWTIGR